MPGARLAHSGKPTVTLEGEALNVVHSTPSVMRVGLPADIARGTDLLAVRTAGDGAVDFYVGLGVGGTLAGSRAGVYTGCLKPNDSIKKAAVGTRRFSSSQHAEHTFSAGSEEWGTDSPLHRESYAPCGGRDPMSYEVASSLGARQHRREQLEPGLGPRRQLEREFQLVYTVADDASSVSRGTVARGAAALRTPLETHTNKRSTALSTEDLHR